MKTEVKIRIKVRDIQHRNALQSTEDAKADSEARSGSNDQLKMLLGWADGRILEEKRYSQCAVHRDHA